MFSARHLCAAIAVILLLGCKVKVDVGGGGRVESLSGTYICTVDDSCLIEVNDTNFDETFTAIPDPGYTFAAWRRSATFCRGKSDPCRLFTTLFPGTPLMKFLELDDTYYLEPDFARSNRWVRGSDMLEGAGAISSCSVKGTVYVFGIGWSSYSSVPAGVAKYDSVKDQWKSLPDMPTRQAWASVGVVDGKCYLIGGASRFGGVASNSVYEFNPEGETWRPRASLPERRTMAAAAVVDNKIYVIGGGDADDFLPGIIPSIAIYDPARNSWSQGADMPTPRFLLAAAAVDGKIYALGGTANASDRHTDFVERYDPATNTWATVASMINRKSALSANVLRGQLYSIGGAAMGFGLSSLVESYDPQSDQWTSRPDLSVRRMAHGSETVDGHIIAFGGFSSSTDLSAPGVAETEIYTD